MRVTSKGQVTIPKSIREKLGIMSHSKVDFVEENGRVYLVKSELEDSPFRRLPLPDFFIGAHAAVERLPLLTRDAKRYKMDFPTVELISPE